MKRRLIGIGAVVLVLALLLTLAPCCGKGEEEATPTPGPGVTPTPGVSPTPTPEVKTFKVGVVATLSGLTPQGLALEAGTKWAASKINEAGGFKVGGDTYMIEVVSCDAKTTASENLLCAQRLVDDEGIRYILGPMSIPGLMACAPLFNERGVWTAHTACYSQPNLKYGLFLYPVDYHHAYHRAFYTMLLRHYPEIKSVGLMDVNYCGSFMESGEAMAEEFGLEVVDIVPFEPGTTDFYPTLLKIMAKGPDAIGVGVCAAGYMGLMIKQARELGFEGVLYAEQWTTEEVFQIAGEYAVGYVCNAQDWTSEILPERTRELYQEYLAMDPIVGFENPVMHAYEGLEILVEGIQRAGSFDPDAVKAALNAPDFSFDFFGFENTKLGGREYYGEACNLPMMLGCSIVKSMDPFELELLDTELVSVP